MLLAAHWEKRLDINKNKPETVIVIRKFQKVSRKSGYPKSNVGNKQRDGIKTRHYPPP